MPVGLSAKMFPSFFRNYQAFLYKRVYVATGEELYYKNGKLVVLVDKELGRKIFDVVTYLADSKSKISTLRMDFRITQYYEAELGTLTAFCAQMKWHMQRTWESLPTVQQLQELVSFVQEMRKIGYEMKESRFNARTCNQIASFLSFFAVKEEVVLPSDGLLLRYIHYRMTQEQWRYNASDGNLNKFYQLASGSNLDKFYQQLGKGELVKVCDFPYDFPLIRTCYQYYKERIVPANLVDILGQEMMAEQVSTGKSKQSYILSKEEWEKNCKAIEQTQNYTTYEGNVRIYHNMPEEFACFLQKAIDNKFISASDIVEEPTNILVDFQGNVIGYCFKVSKKSTQVAIMQTFGQTYELLNYIEKMWKYLLNLHKSASKIPCQESNQFVVETNLKAYDTQEFGIQTLEDLFSLANSTWSFIQTQITEIFFKMYSMFLCAKYGKMDTKPQLLDKPEVRYISPTLAKELMHFMLEKPVDYEVAGKALESFLYKTRNKNNGYDTRFEYQRNTMPFLFDYEVAEKYGIALEKEMRLSLSNGRQLITFSRATTIASLKKKEEKVLEDIRNKLTNFATGDRIKLADISKIICSESINSEGMYKVVGYITNPVKGRLLTKQEVLNLNNKELYLVIGYLVTLFGNYYISEGSIWMDEDFIFYINLLDSNFEIKRLSSSSYSCIEALKQYLVEQGYNQNAFIGETTFSPFTHDYQWIGYANKCDAYCKEHDIYYASADRLCPVCKLTRCFIQEDVIQTLIKLEEDEIASHYRLNSQFNLKVYKPSCPDKKAIEANVDAIIAARINEHPMNLGQECFVPYKKAIGTEQSFIGYSYPAVQFGKEGENSCMDLKNQELSNLARLKALIRLINQYLGLQREGLGFIQNPFGHVYLSRQHKKQVQILNPDFISSETKREESEAWVYQYVYETLASDDAIELDTSQCPDLYVLVNRMQELASKLTCYCKIHKLYYTADRRFCPKCISDTELSEISTEEVEVSKLTYPEPIGEGGESIIYPYGGYQVAKVFKQDKVDLHYKLVVLSRVMRKKKTLHSINKKNQKKFQYVIPQKLLLDSNSHELIAYTMEKVVGGMPISNLKDKKEIQRLGFTRKDVLEILITVAEGIEILHKQGIYIGDLNGRNILFTQKKKVYFLEFDGVGIDEIGAKWWTDGYIDPKSIGNITMKDDWYSFAIQAFHFLTYTHPFNGIYFMEVDGKRRKLEITERMEHRISLLGPHGIKPPDITEPWDWMSSKTITAFLTIFEGEVRVSMLPYLQQEYQKLYGSGIKAKEAKEAIVKITSKLAEQTKLRINQKFIAKKVNPFGAEVVKVINHYAAICNDKGEEYLCLLTEEGSQVTKHRLLLPRIKKVRDVLLTGTQKAAWIIYPSQIVAVQLSNGEVVYSEDIFGASWATVNENTLHFAADLNGEHVLFQRTLLPDGEVTQDRIRFLSEEPTKAFLAKFNSKFVLVKQGENDMVYCNSQMMYAMQTMNRDCEYNILYDSASSSWLVINSEAEGVIITKTGELKTIRISDFVKSAFLVEHVSYRKKTIYIPAQNELYMIKVQNDQIIAKKMECREIMTPESRLYDINQEGFSVITNNVLYEVRKG